MTEELQDNNRKMFIDMLMSGMKVHMEGESFYWNLSPHGFIQALSKYSGGELCPLPTIPSMKTLAYVEYKPREYFNGAEALKRIFDGKKVTNDDYAKDEWYVMANSNGITRLYSDPRKAVADFVMDRESYELDKWYELD